MSAEHNARIARESLEAAFACDWKRLRETYADDGAALAIERFVLGEDGAP